MTRRALPTYYYTACSKRAAWWGDKSIVTLARVLKHLHVYTVPTPACCFFLLAKLTTPSADLTACAVVTALVGLCGCHQGWGTPCICTAHGSLLPRLSHHCIGVYMCMCSSVGPVDKFSHAKLMDEIPPVGGILATCLVLCRSLTSICKLLFKPTWLSECVYISWSRYIQQECAEVKLVFFTILYDA